MRFPWGSRGSIVTRNHVNAVTYRVTIPDFPEQETWHLKMTKAGSWRCACAPRRNRFRPDHAVDRQGIRQFNVGASGRLRVFDYRLELPLYDGNRDSQRPPARCQGGAFFNRRRLPGLGKQPACRRQLHAHEVGCDVAITAIIPDPIVFDRPPDGDSTQPDAEHAENAMPSRCHLDDSGREQVDVGVVRRAVDFLVEQDTITSLTVTEPGPTVTAPLTEVKRTTGGINFGVDVQYLVTKRVAIGGVAATPGDRPIEDLKPRLADSRLAWVRGCGSRPSMTATGGGRAARRLPDPALLLILLLGIVLRSSISTSRWPRRIAGARSPTPTSRATSTSAR